VFALVGLLAVYYDPPVSQVVLLGAITAALTSRGSIFLRGRSDPIELLAPVGQRSAAAKAPDAAVRI
jgi:hypothetical protein